MDKLSTDIFDDKHIYTIFEEFVVNILKIENKPIIEYTDNKSKIKTYAHYEPDNNKIVVYNKGRSLGDVLRSLAHEMVHSKQNELGLLKPGSGETGSPIENKANSTAGVIMRMFGTKYPNIYD